MGQRDEADNRQISQQTSSSNSGSAGYVGAISAGIGDVAFGTSASGDIGGKTQSFNFGAPVINKQKVPYLWIGGAIVGFVLLKKVGWL